MGQRRALVIGARNDRFGVLDFVDDVVTELHSALVDTNRGACVPALPDGRDLLTGDLATSEKIDSALADAISAAAADQATLFVYFLGHGRQASDDFYLIGTDTGDLVDSRTAMQIGQRVKELLDNAPTVDGLMLVLDACHSGAAITDPVPGLLRAGIHARLEIFAATRDDQTASRGCFTRTITRLLTQGSPSTADEYLTAYEEHSRLRAVAPPDCSDMPEAVHLSIRGGLDAGLWLGRNQAADLRRSLRGSSNATGISRLTRNLVQTPSLRQLIGLAATNQPLIAISGGPGAGKSALLSALGRVSITGIYGLDALATVQLSDTLADITERLRPQLELCPDYPAAATAWRSGTPVAALADITEFERIISGPLANLAASARILVGIDGVDLLSTVERRRLFEFFSGQPGAYLIVAGREVSGVEAQVHLPDRDPENVTKLLREIVDDKSAADMLSRACSGDWLLANIVAGLWRRKHDYDESILADDLSSVFQSAVAAAQTAAPNAPLEEVLIVLATAPVGALMPIELLVTAASNGDAEVSVLSVRDSLVALGELVARDAPGTLGEHAGPAHDRIAGFFADRGNPNDLASAHLRVAETVRQMRNEGISEAVISYARRHLSDHLLLAGKPEDAINALIPSGTPADILGLWESWLDRLAYLGPDHPAVLAVRGNIATSLGEAGRPREAVENLTALLPDVARVFGLYHQNTLATQGNLALWTARSGDVPKALDEFARLLSRQEHILGPRNPDTLATRGNIAAWAGEGGDWAGAVRRAKELLPDLMSTLGPSHPSTLNARSTIALYTGRSGNTAEALSEYNSLLSDQKGVLGPDHQDVLATRTNIAMLTAESGNLQQAIKQSRILLQDQRRVFGPDHPYILAARGNLIKWEEQSQTPEHTLRELDTLLKDHERILGPDHPYTLTVRGDIAQYTAESGHLPEAIEKWTGLLHDRERVLGPENRSTLATRNNIAVATWRSGDKKKAIILATALLNDQAQALGADHPDTERTRRNVGEWSPPQT